MSLAHPDHDTYGHFTERQRIDTAVHTLTGMLGGIAIDDELNAAEIAEVLNWCNDHRQLAARAPFNELIPKMDEIMADGVIDPDEKEDLLWLCKNLSPEGIYYDEITHEIQSLQGHLHGILADGNISTLEAVNLQKWIEDHDHLKGTYPYDELDSLLVAVLKDGVVDADEQTQLRNFFENFIQPSFAQQVQTESQRIKSGQAKERILPAICAVTPAIQFDSKAFSFTGSSTKAKRKDIANHVVRLGGTFNPSVTKKIDFLVVGAGGNPCWAFSCYGRKVEKAVEYRKAGHPITIVHESDFWDALEDYAV